MKNSNNGFNTTEPLENFRVFHRNSEIGKEELSKRNRKIERLEYSLTAAGTSNSEPNSKVHKRVWVMAYFIERATTCSGKMEIALAKAARWYIYGRQHISKSTFDDNEFREMLLGFHEVGGGKGTMKYLIRRGLKYWLRGEFDLFKIYLKHVVAQVRESAMGNRFGQGLHDGGTISDKKKRLAMDIQFIDPEWERNHVICFGMTPLSDGSSKPTAELLLKTSLDLVGAVFDDVVAYLTQDLSASAVARAMDYEVDPCDIYQSSKVSASAVGVLVQKKNGKVLNAFPEG